MRLRPEWTRPAPSRGRTGAACRDGGVDVHDLEPEVLEAAKHSVQGRLVREPAGQQCVTTGDRDVQVLEGDAVPTTELASYDDRVVPCGHGCPLAVAFGSEASATSMSARAGAVVTPSG